MRLDLFLVEKNYFPSRTKAKDALESNLVYVNNKLETKGSVNVTEDDIIEIRGNVNPYVSRGGLKLQAAIKEFRLDFTDKVIVDIGASTGGFTDCALQHKAKKVYAVDTGTNQLHTKLLEDNRVISLEQTNILDIPYFPDKIDYLVMDVSFVSIGHLLGGITRFLTDDNALICLIKPQFEVGKVYMKNGVVKDRSVHIKVLQKVNDELMNYNLGIEKLIPSPILGGSGNREFLALIRKGVTTRINFIESVKE